MITYQQLRNKARISRRAHCWSPALFQCPQRRGQYKRLYITTPRKPNSAKRKVGKIILTTGKNIFAKIMGSTHKPNRQAIILVRGHGFKDTPGVGYTIVRGAMECLPVFSKTRRRSIYGVKREILERLKQQTGMFINGGEFNFLIIAVIMTCFLTNTISVLNFLLLCEVIWISIYAIYTLYGGIADSLLLSVWGVIMLCLATSETSLGFGLLILKSTADNEVKSFNINDNQEKSRGRAGAMFWHSLL